MTTKEKMNSNKMTARIVGALFITATVAPISTVLFLGSLNAPDYLINVSANENKVLIGMFVELIWALAVVGILVMLFPILKKHNEALSLGFFSLRFIEAISTIVSSIFLLSLLTLSQEFVKAGVSDASYYQTLGTLLIAARDWAFLLGSGIFFTLSSLILNYILYQSKLIPRWLSVWGLVGAPLLFTSHLLQIFSINLTMILFLPIALQEIVFAVWLIVKGFNSSAINSPSTKTELNEIK